ncbi:FliA/WhiG family RNA polymerase sigma factor [Nocardioides perillae]|uniref:RNA polymerase sigma factor for flagellar operon FliA n=1 Tax=Nocardioides perillae TaxID=1119534 RepID=A0A7Y9UV13_9ACTN|nr:FliA/WhiG family RNA polymerase sigma factor [Nocardioides perillae]NYG54795.1 RNA polymerase sigma factor for flagellar operon FliA [Nocardioides perillae]
MTDLLALPAHPRTVTGAPRRARHDRGAMIVPAQRSPRAGRPEETPVPAETESAVDVPALDAVWTEFKATGEVELRNRLVVQYSPLVKYVAGRVRAGLPQSVDHADLVSEGMIGLIDALEKFEPQRGLAFPTYAVPRIRGAIIDSIRAADWVPRSVRTRVRDVERARAELAERLGRAATDDEVAAELGTTAAELRTAAEPRTFVSYASTDDLADLEELSPALDDAFGDDGVRALLMPAVHALPERDRVVVALYFFEGLTLAEIGQVLGVTESRVSQLRSRATRALREALADLS